MPQDRVRHHRRRHRLQVALDHGVDPVCGEHLERGAQRGFGERVGVGAEEQRTRDPRGAPVLDDRLRDGGHVGVVERALERAAAVARRAERHALSGIRRIGDVRVVRGDQLRHVGVGVGSGRVTSVGVHGHGSSSRSTER